MKKIPYLLILLFAVLLCSCEKGSIPEGKVRVKVRASFYDVFKDLKDTSGKLCFERPLPDSLRFRVGAILYKVEESGKLRIVGNKAVLLSDIKNVAGISMDAEPGNFRVLTTVDVVKIKEGKIAATYNEIGIFKDELILKSREGAIMRLVTRPPDCLVCGNPVK